MRERVAPVLRALPRRAVSRLLGQLGALRPPQPVLRAFLGWYVRRYGANPGEAALPLEAYRSFAEFFTRALRPGARPMPEDAAAIASPADGAVVAAGVVERGQVLQVKGVPYPLDQLLGGPGADAFEGGTHLTVYLAPGDYHRFHWPVSGVIRSVRHVPGDLWPVNARAVAGVPRLFARNERVVLRGEVAGGGAFALVPVGALNVGSMRLVGVPALRTNRSVARPRSWERLAWTGARGDELGRFQFGSSLVLLVARDAGRLDVETLTGRLRLGQPVGRTTD